MAAADPQAISNIYRQLQHGFCPAVRTAAQTGLNLLTLRSAYIKAFNTHLLGLQELAKSGIGICEESNRHSSELSEVADTFLRMNSEDEKMFVNFTNLVGAVTKFSESEKERLKGLNEKYLKDEKLVGKTAKRTGDHATLQEFYNSEFKKVKEQHAQRYAYFAKNYLELLRKQSDVSKKNAEIAEKQLLDSDAADVVKRLEEVVKSNDTLKSMTNEEHLLIRDTDPELYERPIPVEESNLNPIIMGTTKSSVRSLKAEDKSRRGTSEATKMTTSIQTTEEIMQVDSRPNTANSRLSSGSELNLNSYDRNSPSAPPRKILSPHIYKPTPILGLVQSEYEAERQQQALETANEVPKIPRPTSNGNNWNRQEQDYFDAIPRPDYVPETRIYEPPSNKPIPVVKQSYPTYAPPQQPPIAPRNEENRPPPPRYVKPAGIGAAPTYSVSDYGRTMKCTQKYSAIGDHQLSLDVGEHVKLVKSGNRGWLLVRSAEGKQGWFPSKFLNFL